VGLWGRLGQGAWKLRKASADAPEAATVEVERVEEPLTIAQARLLVRYVGARWLLAWLQGVFLIAYGVVVILGLLLWWALHTSGVAVGVVLLLIAALIHWRVTHRIRRLGALHLLRGLDSLAEDAIVVWWPNLRRELRRVGLADGAFGILALLVGVATGRLPATQRQAFDRIEWATVLPRSEWRQARRILADATG
jgi:hypothetical protein